MYRTEGSVLRPGGQGLVGATGPHLQNRSGSGKQPGSGLKGLTLLQSVS